MRLRWVLPAAAIGMAACSSAPFVDTSSFPPVTRRQCLGMAEAYRTHRWTGEGTNILHGIDGKGVRVDTPDSTYQKPGAAPGWWRVNEENQGVPYQWGGFCTLAEFDAGLREGKAAGDVCTREKRRLLDDAVTTEAVGIDCSGFVSRCWKLPRSCSTRELAGLCSRLRSWDDLQPGDILNTYNAHCLLFAGWDDPKHIRIATYETGRPPNWKVSRHIIDAEQLRSLGYQPLRYRNMRDG